MDRKLMMLIKYGSMPCQFRSFLKGDRRKVYRKDYETVNSMLADKKNERLNDIVDLITFQESLLNNKKFILIDAHEE